MKKILILIFILGITVLYSATPQITLLQLFNDNDGQKTNPATALTGNDEMTLWFQVKDFDGFTNIETIDVIFWDSNHSSLTDVNSDEFHAQYKYYNEFSDWSLIGPFSWAISKEYSTGPAVGIAASNEQNFTLVFKPGAKAVEEYNPDWKITIVVKDHDGNQTNMTKSYSLTQIDTSSSVGSGGVFYIAPNPFKFTDSNSLLHLYYEPGFSANCTVSLEIFTISGDPVKTIFSDKHYSAGQTLSETWNCQNGVNVSVASGIYTAVLSIKYESGEPEKQYFKFAIYK